MYTRLYNYYFNLTRKLMGGKTGPFFKLYRKLYSLLFQLYLNKIVVNEYQKQPHCSINQRKDVSLIASMTTFGVRTDKVWITIESLLRQSYPLDKIVVWLDKGEYKNGITDVPDSLKAVVERQKGFVEVRFVEGIKAYKKLWFAIQEFTEANIITFDDDVFYPYDTVEKLMGMHEKYPKDIVAISAEEISDNFFALPDKWEDNRKYNHFNHVEHSYMLRMLGLSGVLYPPHCFHKDVSDMTLMKKLCPWNDDLWWTVMAVLNETRLTRYEFRSNPLGIWTKDKKSLSNGTDAGSTKGISNNTQWQELTAYYSEQLETILNK